MCWPEISGAVEVEERRPRTWNEPRRKRLNFVRGHGRDSDEWVPNPRRLTEREIWYRRRAQEMQQRVMHPPIPHPQLQGHCDPRMVQLPPAQPQWQNFQPGHHGHQPGHHGHQPRLDQPGHQAQLDRHSHHSDDDIGAFESGHGGHDGHDDPHHPNPRIIYREPPKSSSLPEGLKARPKKPAYHKKKYTISSSASDDSSSCDDTHFSEGFRAGRRSLSRVHVARGRSRSRCIDDSYEDLMHSRLRSSSRRGRR